MSMLLNLANVPVAPILDTEARSPEELTKMLREKLWPHAMRTMRCVRFTGQEWQALTDFEKAIFEEAAVQVQREQAALIATACGSKEGLAAVYGDSQLREFMLVEEAAEAMAAKAEGKEIQS